MLRILLVDDEDIEIHGLIAMIKTFGLPLSVCASARNGMDGLQKARDLKPHVIITDLRMPKMSGIEMLEQLDREGFNGFYVLVSGFEDFDAARKGLELGTMAYLLKPVNRDDLFRVLLKCCGPVPGNTDIPINPSPKNLELYSPSEEQFMRRLLFTPEGRVEELLASQPAHSMFSAKYVFAVATVEILPSDNRHIYDYLECLQIFTKSQNAPAPVITDSCRCVIALGAPTFVEESVFIDNTIKKFEELLLDLYRLDITDVFIGISDIGIAYNKLPALYSQSLLALKQRPQSNSHILLYDSKSGEMTDYSGQSVNQVVMRIQKIIREDFSKPLSIDIIAERLYLSPSHIRRLFKNQTGTTIMDYLENVRLSHSRRLLAQRQYKIHEIGGLVGYESPSYFNVVFKKYYGQTPGEYRKSLGI